MVLNQEVMDSLKREESICDVALSCLQKMAFEFEEKYAVSTDKFIEKFQQGAIGDAEDFFKWYAIVQGMNDWRRTQHAIEEVVR